jgi:hypothetical protein
MTTEPRAKTRRRGIRVFSTALSTKERRIYGFVATVFIGTFFATMWPIYPLFNRIRPFFLGVPASLVYLVILVFVCFFSLLALYRWEDRRGKLE